MTDSLGINEKSDYENATVTDPVHNVIHKFFNHPNIVKINNHYQHDCSFHFHKISLDAVDLEIRALNPNKAAAHNDIPSKILKSILNICLEQLMQIINNCI